VKRFFNWNPDRSFFPYHAAKGWVLFYRCGDVEGGRGEVRALVGIENLGPTELCQRLLKRFGGARNVLAFGDGDEDPERLERSGFSSRNEVRLVSEGRFHRTSRSFAIPDRSRLSIELIASAARSSGRPM
jgi:hypothetical protein